MRAYGGNNGGDGNGGPASMVAHESANFGSVLNTTEEPIRLLFVGDGKLELLYQMFRVAPL